MADAVVKQIVVSERAGVFDTLLAAGRLVAVIAGSVPLLIQLLGKHQFAELVVWFQGDQGKALIGALGSLVAMGFALRKSFKRGTQVASVATNPDVPDAVATTKGSGAETA